MKYLLLILLVLLFSCGNVTPKHKFAVIYEFEFPERLSTNDKQGTIETLNKRLERIASNYEVRFNNKEQIEVSKFYEKLPKPHALAVKEWLDDKIYHRNTEDTQE